MNTWDGKALGRHPTGNIDYYRGNSVSSYKWLSEMDPFVPTY